MAEELDVDLDEVYNFALQLGKEAGALLYKATQDRINGTLQHNQIEKESAVDIVTQVDEDVEQAIRKRVTSKFPSHKYDPSPISATLGRRHEHQD